MDLPAGFDPSTMTYLATQLVQPSVGGAVDPYHDMLLPAEMHQSAYTDYGYVRCHPTHAPNLWTDSLVGVQ